MTKYKFLEPIKIGSKTLKNRIIMSSMIKSICTEDGFVTDNYIAYYTERARGGVGLIVSGAMVVDPEWHYIFYRQPWLSHDKYIPGLRQAIEAVQKEGALFVAQLWHNGLKLDDKGNPVTKSVNDFTINEIQDLQEKYFNAAKRAKMAGADGVEFHCAHCYLPNQFLSPYFNHRTDRYGSRTVEDATRFSTEIMEKINEELVDDNFILIAKINGSDFVEGGTTPEWAADAGALFESAGVSMITVNGGGSLTKIIGMSDDGRQPEGWKVPFAEIMKTKVHIPVAANGSLRHPEYIDQCMQQGKFDVAALGRALVSEPEWVNKVALGREDELKHCISCMFCLNFNNLKGGTCCSINPYATRELSRPGLKMDGDGRKTIVVGAGPAGLEAAVTLAERGFSVEIYEANSDIGGQVLLAAIPPGKSKLGWITSYYANMIDRLGIKLNLGMKVTTDVIVAQKPYAVVVTTGSAEMIPPIEGLALDFVIDARTMLKSNELPSGKCISVLGGGLTGLETARMLQERGNSVTILEMLSAPEANIETLLSVGDCMAEGISVLFGHKVIKVAAGHVVAKRITDEELIAFPADIVVRSFGIRPEEALYKDLLNRLENVYKAGDCSETGKIYSAVVSGNHIAHTIA